MDTLTVRRMTPEDRPALHDLRLRILRPGRPPEAAIFPGDDEATTTHIGAFLPDGTCVGIATLLADRGLRLRGMAVDAELQRGGVGRAILAEAYQVAAEQGYDSIWCDARVSASGFYAKEGWQKESDEYMVPDVGPHYKMRRMIQQE